MIYCCGASMIGMIGTVSHKTVKIYNVPVLICPVCQSLEIHPAVNEQFELVLEYALEDRVKETTLYEQIDPELIESWKEYCFSFQTNDAESVIREQIDLALDLLRICKPDDSWAEELKRRLKVLSQRLKYLEEQKENSF